MTSHDSIEMVFGHYRAGRLKQAETVCRKILKRQPQDVDALHLLGIIHRDSRHPDIAIKYFRAALQIDPCFAGAYNNLGAVLQESGRFDEAADCYKKALELDPSLAKTYYNLGVVLQEKGRFDEAVSFYQKAIGRNLNTFGLYNNLGLALQETGNLDGAIDSYQKAIQLNRHFAEARYNLGNALQDKRQFDEALACYKKALEISPDYAEAHWNMALVLLLTGNFKDGWKEYEWRWKLKKHYQYKFTQPLWDGSDISGRTILLHAEQGLGDTIQFVRYASLVAERAGKVIIECPAELAALLENVRGIHQVKARGEPLPPFDIHCPVLSLPLAFDTRPETIPADIPYINTDPTSTQKWGYRMRHDRAALKIGLVWSGNPTHKNDRKRSIPLSMFSPLARFKDVTFYSLQLGEAKEQAAHPPEDMKLIDHTDDINDLSDTAALIQNLDLVISVDTVVAHLAGALAKPVWLLLPFLPDWRWMLDRNDSPWYPSMRLFRQTAPGNWKSVVASVKKELSAVSFTNNHA